MSRKKGDAFSEAVVGLFMVSVLALLGYFTIVISGVDVLSGRGRVPVRVAFEQVGGLKAHDSVMYRGTKVGTVDDIIVTSSNLVVVAEIDAGVVLRRTCRVTVCNLSMLGGNYLLLEEGEGEIVDASRMILAGETPSDWMRDVSKIAKNLNALVSMPELSSMVTNLEAASASARVIAGRIERGEGTVGRLLGPDDALYDDVRAAVTNANRLIANLDATAVKLRSGEGTIGKLLADDKIHRDLEEAIASFKSTCRSFDGGKVVESADRLLGNLNVVAERLRNGEGTVGKLIKDDRMYREVEGLVRDIRQMVDNYRDTTPISTFSSLATGAL
jgi:phospholipid/cholesterol/gamma-HCH transport system substrate-binding protein